VGCDFHPDVTYLPDACFRYDFVVLEGEQFYQGPVSSIWWLSIAAVYFDDPWPHDWGWKTREHFFNDDAVHIFIPSEPVLGSDYIYGFPVEGPYGLPWDMAFVLTGEGQSRPQPPDLPWNPVHHVPKHRYISIDPSTNAPSSVAIKVEIAEMRRCAGDLERACLQDSDCKTACENDHCILCTTPIDCGGQPCIETGPCIQHPDVGLSWFVQEPQRNEYCPWSGPPCGDEDWYARVDANVYGEDWSAYSTLHIGDCEVVPNVTYNVYACDPANPDYCSDPLAVPTQVMPYLTPRDYGDVGGPATPEGEFTPPDGFADAVDIEIFMQTSANWGNPDLPQVHPTWVDLSGLGTGIPPDYRVDVRDVLVLSHGVTHNLPWTWMFGGLDPGECASGTGGGDCAPGYYPPHLPPDEEHRARKHRYLSIDVTTNQPFEVGYLVYLAELKRCSGNRGRACAQDGDCDGDGTCINTAAGPLLWVQEPQEYVEGCRRRCDTFDGPFCDSDAECPGNDCSKKCGPTDQFARLDDTPYFSDWIDPRFPLTTLHIGDCEIVPGATYEISTCSGYPTMTCGQFPLWVGTVRRSWLTPDTRAYFGDIAAAPSAPGDPYGPPDGFTNVTDLQALLATLVNFPGTDVPQPHVTWVDLHGNGVGTPPQYYPNVSDLQMLQKALSLNETWTGAHSDNRNPQDCP
jgi:hypothetical protein